MHLSVFMLLRIVLVTIIFACANAYEVIHTITITSDGITEEGYLQALWAIHEFYAGRTPTYASADEHPIVPVYRRNSIAPNTFFAIGIIMEEEETDNQLHLVFHSEDLYFVGWTNSRGQRFVFSDWNDRVNADNSWQPLTSLNSSYGVHGGLPLENAHFSNGGFMDALRYFRSFTIPSRDESYQRNYIVYIPVFFSEASRFPFVRARTQSAVRDFTPFDADHEFMAYVHNWGDFTNYVLRLFTNIQPDPIPDDFPTGSNPYFLIVSLFLLKRTCGGNHPRKLAVDSYETSPSEDIVTPDFNDFLFGYYFSEESSGESRSEEAPINAIECYGSYCDKKSLVYSPTLHGYLDYSKQYEVGPFSEEGAGSRICPTNTVVSRIKCSGRYCDNLTLVCSPFKRSSVYNVDNSNQHWTEYHSEEDDGLESRYRCPDDYFVNGIACSGGYCDNIRLSCVKVTSFALLSSYLEYSFGRTFSEESSGQSPDKEAPINAIVCYGSYCDEKQLSYSPTLEYYLDYSKQYEVGPFSEEGAGSRTCPTNTVVSRIKCSGGYCDNLTLVCSPFKRSSVYNVDNSNQHWTEYHSEEDDGLAKNNRCLDGYFVNGIACSGHYCDKIMLSCVEVGIVEDWRTIFAYSLSASYFSEEYSGQSPDEEAPINAIACKGSYCDKKSLVYSPTLHGYLDHSKNYLVGPFSEEAGSRICPTNTVVSRIKCSSSYCDNLTLVCSPFKRNSIYNVNDSNQHWTEYHSEEDDGLALPNRCQNGYFVNGIACSGPYCDNIKLSCVEVGIVEDCRTIFDYSLSIFIFSEEYPSESRSEEAPINAIECYGSYCDKKSLVYSPTLHGYLDYSMQYEVGPFSEEGAGFRTCPTNTVVSRIKCSGGYCDNLTLVCSPFKRSSVYNVDNSNQYWTEYHSEEDDGLAKNNRCLDGYFVNGIACRGGYCDDIRLSCVKVFIEEDCRTTNDYY